MKIAKPDRQDIAAAGDAMSVLSDISSGYYPARPGELSAPTWFDEDDPAHLRRFYDLMASTMERAPSWPTRVIGGMCFAICYERNAILDPSDDCLGLHPDLRAGLDLLHQQRADFLPKLEREALAAVAETIECAAVRHLREMKWGP